MLPLPLPRGVPITGTDRVKIGRWAKSRYAKGRSIESIAEELGRSFDWTRTVLLEAGVKPRGRGGARYRKPSQ